HNYYIEDGVETGNRFVDNLGMLPRSTPDPLRVDKPVNNRKERASAFWITNPANAFEDNHAVGVPSGQGFWFAAPDNGSGTAVKKGSPLKQLPLQQFENNTAHSIMFDPYASGNLGYRFNWTGNGLELGEVINNNPNNAAIEDFTALKVGNMAIQVGPTRTIEIKDPVLAEARIMVQSASRSRKPGNTPLQLINPTLIAETQNTKAGRELRSLFPKNFPGPVIHESARPLEFVSATIFGEETLKYSKRKEFQDKLTLVGNTSTPTSPEPNPEPPVPEPNPEPPVPEPNPEPPAPEPDPEPPAPEPDPEPPA
ncbi:MAG: hypothetical protein AAGL17_25480, partial [Cyanobacteria bacterium J06576_12]